MQIIIIGAVAGGASAAARARRLSEDAEIVLIERGEAPSFANCGLPYYIGGVIDKRDKLLVTSTQRLVERYRLDVRTRTEAVAIDRANRTVHVRDLAANREYDLPYDKLILSPGASPLIPPIPGVELSGVYTLRDLRDADRLHAAVQKAKRAVVIGGGFIGIEMAENLVHRGIDTTVVEVNKQVLPPWDAEMVAPFAVHLQKHGVKLQLNDAAEGISSADGALVVNLRSGAKFPADIVIMSIGVRPENRLAVAAGLEVGPRGGIRTNDHMQTTDPDIYAVGDAVETRHAIDHSTVQIPLGGPANRQGRIAADHIFDRPSRYRGTQGTAIVGAFGMAAAMTGFSEKALRAAGTPFHHVTIHPAHHANYFPGAETMSLKLLFAPETGRILGAQAVGGAGVDKRIDVIAVAIQAGLTVEDLEEVELAYAPQFGSAKDPINMAGFVASNLLRGDGPVAHVDDLPLESTGSAGGLPTIDAALPESAGRAGGFHGDSAREFILDVRSPGEFSAGHIPGATNIPIEELRDRLGELPRSRPIAAYCQVGMRGYLATRLLAQRGFPVRNLSGGYTTYQAVRQSRG
jgi:NADPH-dependent 2,4-dienoyl-CoA reductase/sulfur reductase-like enzyme/rhodanese-related sulfurtransferase